jgi:sugar lactone lactonase YvrE
VDTSGRSSSSSETSSEEEEEEEETSVESYDETSEDSDETCEVDEEDITTTEVDTHQEYIVQEVDGGCEHCDDEFLQVSESSYPQLSGDMYDNDETDSSYLTLVSPSSSTDAVSWEDDIYDGDEQEYSDDKEDTDNPAGVHSFLQEVDNALNRDEDDLPDDFDDSGDDPSDGELAFILVTTFVDEEAGRGTVVVVPEEDEEIFTLITGLDKPVGICFDVEHDFLYVVDSTFGSEGYIYQFTIDWDDDDTFELATTDYTVVYQGANPYSCFVDEYGNLYFTDAYDEQINLIQYIDLWSGFTNYFVTLYARDDEHAQVSTPVGVTVYESEDLYFVNNNVDNGAAVLVKGRTVVAEANGEQLEDLATASYGGWAVAVSDDYVFFTTGGANVWVYDLDDEELSIKSNKYIEDPRGICYSDDSVYVADFARGQITELDDDADDEEGELWEAVENAYALFCVNY